MIMEDIKEKVMVITSGGFDPIHPGHIEYLQKAKELYKNAYHICIVNDDDFLIRKKGFCFQEFQQRAFIVSSLRCIDSVFRCHDTDGTVCETIKELNDIAKECGYSKVVFAKGGDRFANEIPEAKVCKELGIEIVDGLGEKIFSSSELVERSKKHNGVCSR